MSNEKLTDALNALVESNEEENAPSMASKSTFSVGC
jgi:hypothetical protein